MVVMRLFDDTRIMKYLVSIVNALDAAIGEVDIESPDSWQAEYVQRVSRLSKWYQHVRTCFTGNNAYRNLLEELMPRKKQMPFGS